ncbi:esterase/lipase family protein [Bradyrhizobium elkanii]|uniref:Pimeloyl-ACP methyl ester carboxylesterase n=1 Tax=Bradyrhizobium elkanii TaxID=29448 RepID=A0ABV4F484_BRAEL|nr:alpha/beta fold hydrolase [Bradyrhizobium elkanii]MCP1749832.1 pimeloyl-ACP methyl ester carboxylesterase [Bradyrhizobium elkanii]MCP1984406.1 pimeloyl-ACP methyl ester carboxylesterase [Bradyrhizobium elkanii]MCS3889875.1 pimeloyl-ACP methyl ester carboxylesterase [Bradyrhizobium elkanii]MCS4211102.1 pimeloyl-ACP methyl ester carboxylesterase [Bradyrhizobium elkanii]MCW2193263.1 pimeloyl-ACP methyl ester carboxylesterase [Bradyrhizobium elkanii]
MSERRQAASTLDGVVLLHGISRTARSFRRMELALRTAGFAPLNLDYDSRRKGLDALAEDIHPSLDQFARSLDGSVHFVCHSMGGLLARVYLARHRPARLGRVVMLGTPNGGSEIADRLKNLAAYRAYFGPAGQQLVTRRDAATSALLPSIDYCAGIIAGNRSVYPITSIGLPRPHDGRVSVANTRLDGMADHIVIRTSHPWLVRNREAIAQTIAFLQEGRFSTNRQVD